MHHFKNASPEPECLKVDYQVGKVIGTGKFSVVKECTERASKKKYALKVIHKAKAKEDYEAVKNEVAILKSTQHQNIISLHQEILSSKCHYLVLEFANNGDLFELISEQGSFSEHDVSHMINDVIGGVRYLHSLNICHRDIKPENILVHRLGLSRAYHSYTDLSKLGGDYGSCDSIDKRSSHDHNGYYGDNNHHTGNNINNNHMHTDAHDHIYNTLQNSAYSNHNGYPNTHPNNHPNNYNNNNHFYNNNNISDDDLSPQQQQQQYSINNDIILKIADFGLATYATKPLYTLCGTPTYVAPEVISETGYGLKVDVWSTGVLAYILLCGFPPFDSEIDDQEELFELIVRSEADLKSVDWERIGDEAKALVVSMLLKDPEARPSASDIYDHPWVKRNREDQADPCGRNEEKVEEAYQSDDASVDHCLNITRSIHLTINSPGNDTIISSDDHLTVIDDVINDATIDETTTTATTTSDTTTTNTTTTTTNTTTTTTTSATFSIGPKDMMDDGEMIIANLESISINDDTALVSITTNDTIHLSIMINNDDGDDDDGDSITINSVASNTTTTANSNNNNNNNNNGDDDDDDDDDENYEYGDVRDDDDNDHMNVCNEINDVYNIEDDDKGVCIDDGHDNDYDDGDDHDGGGDGNDDGDGDDYSDVCGSLPGECLMEVCRHDGNDDDDDDDDDVNNGNNVWFDAECGADAGHLNTKANNNRINNSNNNNNGNSGGNDNGNNYFMNNINNNSNMLGNSLDNDLIATIHT